jgi:hypothetical protein
LRIPSSSRSPDHDPHRTIYYLGYPLGRFAGLKHRHARNERFRQVRLARCRGEGAGSRPLHGGSSRHFARVTSTFLATHRSIYVPPAATLLARSPLFPLRHSRCSLYSLPLFFIDFSSIHGVLILSLLH